MKAWRLHDKEVLTLDDLPIQQVDKGCVKIKTLMSALSTTDTLMYAGKMPCKNLPLILGRQCVGMVTEVGEGVTGLQRGDRVVADPFIGCKVCPACLAGKTDECEKPMTCGVDDNGYLSDFTVLPASSVYALPERITDRDAIFAEHIALSIHVVNKLELNKGEHIVIMGANILGLVLAQVAIYYQAVPILVDTDAADLALAEELGIYYTVNSVESDPMKKIFTITGGKMAETAAFLSMSQMSFGRSLDYVGPGGRVAIVGFNTCDDLGGNLEGVLRKQLRVIGVNNGARMFSAAINLLANRTVDVSRLVRNEVPFAEADTALHASMENYGRVMKTLVKF